MNFKLLVVGAIAVATNLLAPAAAHAISPGARATAATRRVTGRVGLGRINNRVPGQQAAQSRVTAARGALARAQARLQTAESSPALNGGITGGVPGVHNNGVPGARAAQRRVASAQRAVARAQARLQTAESSPALNGGITGGFPSSGR